MTYPYFVEFCFDVPSEKRLKRNFSGIDHVKLAFSSYKFTNIFNNGEVSTIGKQL